MRFAARLLPASSLVAAALAISTACSPSDTKAADTHAVSATSAFGTHFTTADFAHLRWLAGDWRATAQGMKPSYERYAPIDDSTMRWRAFVDSTFTRQKDSATIALRGGRIADQGSGTPWFATTVDTNRVNFGSQESPANHFIWLRTSANSWTAHVFTTDKAGVEARALFQLERMNGK